MTIEGRQAMKTIKATIILLFATIVLTFSACGSESSENKVVSNARELINQDLSDDISINKCLYSEKDNAIYMSYSSDEHGDDEAIILLDDNTIIYESVYSTIKEDDYEKIIKYGDYAVLMYQIALDDSDGDWEEINISD